MAGFNTMLALTATEDNLLDPVFETEVHIYLLFADWSFHDNCPPS
jgi:hypothetical protein